MNFTMIPAMKVVDDGRMVRAWIELKGIDQRGAIRLLRIRRSCGSGGGGELEAEPEPGGGTSSASSRRGGRCTDRWSRTTPSRG